MEFLTEEPIVPDAMFDRIARGKSGSVVFHYAVVRMTTGDKVTSRICFERTGDTEAELAAIAAEIRSRWNIDDVLLARCLGTLLLGDVMSLVAISSPSSKDAFEACQAGVEQLKKMKTLRRCEVFLDTA